LLKEPQPAQIFLDKDYMDELKRRAVLMGPGLVTDQADPERISDRDYHPFFYDPNEMQKMMAFQKTMPSGHHPNPGNDQARWAPRPPTP